MNDHNSFDTDPLTDSGHALSARTQILSLKQAQANPSFAKPISLYDKWCTLAGPIPHHKNITPPFIGAETLPEMYIIDVIGNQESGFDFRWRLFGTEHSNRYGKEATGVLLSEAAKSDPSAAGSYKVAQQVLNTLEPAFFQTEFIENDAVHKTTSTVVMPLSDDGGQVSRLFGCSSWSRL